MKNLFLFFSCLLLISSAKAGDKDKKYFETSIFSVGEKLYPRFIIEDQSNFTSESSTGLWAMAEYSNLPYTPNSWKEKGYVTGTHYDLDVKVGVTYDYSYGKFIFGVDVSSNKKCFGPLFGITFSNRKFYFQAIGFYSVVTPYQSCYERQDQTIPRIYIKGFDPNSLYKVKLVYSLSRDVDIGIVSERFYGTCISSEYNLTKILKFKFMFGRDIEFSENVFCFGLLFNMKNIDTVKN